MGSECSFGNSDRSEGKCGPMSLNELPFAKPTSRQTAFFVYDLVVLQNEIIRVRNYLSQAFPGMTLSYSAKSNPNPGLLKAMQNKVDGFDLSSKAELEMLLGLGISPSQISLSGPGKTNEFLKLALDSGVRVIQVDSEDELREIQKHPAAGKARLSLRVQTPDIFSDKLGFSLLHLEKLLPGLSVPLVGLHIYLGRENYSEARAKPALQMMQVLFQRFPQKFIPQPEIYFGPGVQAKQTFQPLSSAVWSANKVHLELGRSLVATCGTYAAPVLAVKTAESGARFVIIDGGLQHLGSPFFSLGRSLEDLKVEVVRDGKKLPINPADSQEILLSGSLCLWHDVLHPRLRVPRDLRRGDFLLFPDCGAYGLTAGVPHFIGESLPAEWLWDPDSGTLKEVTVQSFRSYHECFDFQSLARLT
jgi:diaminopimelate decarboxylase